MKTNMKATIKIFLLATTIFFGSCTDLGEEILDESLTGDTKDTDLVRGAMAPAYGMLPEFYRHTTYFAVQEISTDEAILPYRGGRDWGDNGIYIELHQHTYTPVHSNIQQCWDFLTRMISRTVTAINVLASLAGSDGEAKTFLAEARGLRAFYNMITLDLWGIAFQKDDPNELSVILRGSEAVDYIRSEFEAVVGDLRTDVGPGRLTQGGVYGLLARLHLNAAVWRDPYASSFDFTTADMDKVIQYANMVINSGQYSLSSEYFANFNNDNHNNPELVFAVDQRPDVNGHNRMSYFSMSDNFYGNPLFPQANGTDGAAITSDFYDSWVDANGSVDPAEADARFYWQRMIIPADSAIAAGDFESNRGIYRGLQYGLQNTGRRLPFIQVADGRYKIGKLRDWRRAEANAYVDYTREINFTAEGSDYNRGYRVEKYQWSKASTDGRNRGEADLIIVRLADLYMMRAEAKLRKGDASGALDDVNLVRASRTARPALTPEPLTEMNPDILFRERGFEFYWEHQRRTDMIRFGKYEGIWTEKTDSNVKKRLFPIPQAAIDGASNNPGYLVQNSGY
jgi:starch-binding outer membrane protein, SusD/RagB family